MSDDLRFIVGQLKKPPYNRNYNLITFDALTPEQLLQVLNDVFAEIDPKNRMDIREEEPEQMAIRMLGMLRILKYKPPDEIMDYFRQGLVAGEKHVIQPVLLWLLQHEEELRKRAYLAKYLVKLEVASDVLGDSDIDDIYEKYEDLIEQFKNVHREYERMKNSGFSTAELRKDISAMEDEKELVTRRIERMRQKVEVTPNHEALLSSTRALRKEKERQKQLQLQETEIKAKIHQLEDNCARLEEKLLGIRKADIGNTPEALLQRLEDDFNVNSYMLNEKLPKELEAKRQRLHILQKVSSMPAMGQHELEQLHKQINNLTEEISTLNETRMKELEEDDSSDNKVGKLSFFRQNASIISRKKEQTAERLSDLKNELHALQEEAAEKQEKVKEFSGEQILRGDDFKRYVNELRGKSSVYKTKRAQMNALRAEFGVLSRTEEILKAKSAHISEQLGNLESQMGVGGFLDTQETLEAVSSQKAVVDTRKGKTLEEMSVMVRELNQKIAERKAKLAPIIKELRPLRQKFNDFSVNYQEKKSAYDSVAAGLDTNMANLENQVKTTREEVREKETKNYILGFEKELLTHKLQQMNDEIKLYISKDSQDKKKSLREQLMNLIVEQEKDGRMLREEQKGMKDMAHKSGKQLRMWEDIIKLMEVKKRCLDASRSSGHVVRNIGSESLVL